MGVEEDEEKIGMFGEKILADKNHPKMRYSIQDGKNPFYENDKTPLDERRTESEPAVKYKDYNNDTEGSNKRLSELLHDIRKNSELGKDSEKVKDPTKELLNEPKEETKDIPNEDDKKSDELDQTDDKPSIEEEKKLDISGKSFLINL